MPTSPPTLSKCGVCPMRACVPGTPIRCALCPAPGQGILKLPQPRDLLVIGCCLPAFLLHQPQGILSFHTSIDKHGTGQQNTPPNTMFAVNQDATSLPDPFLHPGSSLSQLLNRQRIRIRCR